MIFKPEMAAKVIVGSKTETRRPADAKTDYEVGRDYAVQPGRGKHAVGRILILSRSTQKLRFITEGEARAEGFANRQAFLDYWRSLYGGEVDLDQLVHVYRFRLHEPRPALIGVQSCGCVTYANSRPDELNGRDTKALAQVLREGGQVLRTTVGEARAMPDFLPSECPHDPKGWERVDA